MEKFNNKYRIPSARLQNWDYSQNGAYFITICTENRFHHFGKIIDGEMILNEIGILAEKYWNEIVAHFPFVELGNFVIMPNHMHGILILDKNVKSISQSSQSSIETLCATSLLNNMNENADGNTNNNTNEKSEKNKKMSDISPKPGSVSTIIRSYKSVVTKNARLINANFAWQTRFHDHIIRNSKSFENIQNYIANNPKKWQEDKFY